MAQLQTHNFRTRMTFAYMADALLEFDGSVRTGSTLDRVTNGDHPYGCMWRQIEYLYEHMTDAQGTLLSELSMTEFMHFCTGATSTGFTHDGSNVPAAAVRSKAAQWARRGWFRYEEKRDEKVKKARRFGLVGGLILSSFIL